jgi:hypothetical protein
MHEVMQWKKGRLFIINALPGDGTVIAKALQDGAPVSSFGELQNQGAPVYPAIAGPKS